jgi:hypothetical protein
MSWITRQKAGIMQGHAVQKITMVDLTHLGTQQFHLSPPFPHHIMTFRSTPLPDASVCTCLFLSLSSISRFIIYIVLAQNSSTIKQQPGWHNR